MSIGAALIGAGSNLLGGILSKPRAKDNFWGTEAGIHAQIKYTREHAENYGFNPLAWIGNTQVLGAAPSNSFMGSAVADAGMILADAMAKKQDLGRLERAERLNEKLSRQVTDLTLRPAVPGVYGMANGGFRNAAGVSRGASGAAGNPGSRRASGNVEGVVPGLTPNPVVSGREKDVMPLPNSPGVFEIENNVTGGVVTVPGDSEPWGIDELATAMLIGGPQAAWNWGRKGGLELRKAIGGKSPGEKRRGPANTGKKKARNVLGMFPTLGPMPNPWFDPPW